MNFDLRDISVKGAQIGCALGSVLGVIFLFLQDNIRPNIINMLGNIVELLVILAIPVFVGGAIGALLSSVTFLVIRQKLPSSLYKPVEYLGEMAKKSTNDAILRFLTLIIFAVLACIFDFLTGIDLSYLF